MIQWGLFASRLQWAASSFREDPVFAAQVYRMTQACPSDPLTATLALELATLWAHDNHEARLAVLGLPPLPLRSPVIPDDVLDHWLDWQRHLGRHSCILLEQDGFVVLNTAPTPMVVCGHQARPSPVLALATRGFIQVASGHAFSIALPGFGFEPALRQTVAVMPTLTAARLPRELPEGFELRQVTDVQGVRDYQAVTREAYAASYGVDHVPVDRLIHAGTLLGYDDVQAWVVYQEGRPVRVISGFVAKGIVGAHAGAAVPDVRGRHFSEPLLATVATWGHALGANVLAGIAMPQAVPILTRIGALIVQEYVTYRRS